MLNPIVYVEYLKYELLCYVYVFREIRLFIVVTVGTIAITQFLTIYYEIYF